LYVSGNESKAKIKIKKKKTFTVDFAGVTWLSGVTRYLPLQGHTVGAAGQCEVWSGKGAVGCKCTCRGRLQS
jgi:hypothetical protein